MRIMPIVNAQPQNNKSQSPSFNGKLFFKLKPGMTTGYDTGTFSGYTSRILLDLSEGGKHKVQYHEINNNPYDIYLEFGKELDNKASELLNKAKQKAADQFNRVIESNFVPSP